MVGAVKLAMLTFAVAACWPAVADAAPSVVFDSTPPTSTNQTSATFRFHAAAGGTLKCSLDSGAFSNCSSPFTASGLAEGPHTFSARADATGIGAPATFSWTVDLTPPTTLVTAKRRR
jgi:large repetitive protein